MLYSVLTFLGCSLLLIVPTTCMGATLPILCRFYVQELEHLGNRVGRLSGVNAVGAAAGSLLCGFWLIERLGVWGAQLLVISINAAIGLYCLWLGWHTKQGLIATKPAQSESSDRDYDSNPLTFRRRAAAGALVVFGVSGFCAMAYQIIWTRLLSLVAGPTTYSFTLVLAAFITGLALGSVVFGWVGDRMRHSMYLLLTTQGLAALLALAAGQLLGNSQVFFAKLIFISQENFVQLHLVKAAAISSFLLGPTFLLGATLPLVGKIYTRSVGRVGQSIGFAYAVNTTGAVLGAFCYGFVLIPLLGKERALGMVVALQMVSCLAVAWICLKPAKRRAWKLASLLLAGVMGLVLCFHYPQWNRRLLSRGLYHRFSNFVSGDLAGVSWREALVHGSDLFTANSHNKLIYYGDGIGGLTAVAEAAQPMGNKELFMYNEGKSDASSMQDMSTQMLLAHLPLLFHAIPQTVMVLGLASGITAGEVLHYPIERLDVLEISPEVVEGSAFFLPWNNRVLSNPKTDLIIQDGRVHLQLTDRSYDIIIAEPSNPWMAGLASLFTSEFFELAKERLNSSGIFIQWFHSYGMDWKTFSLVGRTFAEVFPNNLCVTTTPGLLGPDYLLVGFKGTKKLVAENAQKNIVFARQSSNMRLADPKLLYRLVLSEDLKSFFGDGPVNTDDRPRLEFAAPRLMYRTDLDVEAKIVRKGMHLTRETIGIRQQMLKSIDSQIDFAAFAFSLHQPLLYPGLVDLANATPSQADRYYALMDAFVRDHEIDYLILKDNEAIRLRSLAIQIEALKRRLALNPANKGMMQQHLLKLQTLAATTN